MSFEIGVKKEISRSEFGHQCYFSDRPARVIESIATTYVPPADEEGRGAKSPRAKRAREEVASNLPRTILVRRPDGEHAHA